MKLDVSALRFLTPDEFRVLVAVEMGMKNHELVPVQLISSIANIKVPLVRKAIKTLHKNKLIAHDAKFYDGFKLTYLGYDFLAIKAMTHRESLFAVGQQIGVGKESDIYLVVNSKNEELCLKLHRLGRISFRAIKEKRDYLKHRKSASWLYMARLAALKEFAFMKALHEHGFPVPKPIDNSRHCVLMSLVRGYPLVQVNEVRHPGKGYSDLMNIITKLARHGLIHCDFNEFNLMIDDEEKVTLIDFPQMVSTTHKDAEYFFDRDVNCIRVFFERRFGFIADSYPKFSDYSQRELDLDVEVEASGFNKSLQKELETFYEETKDEREAAQEGEDQDNEGSDEEKSLESSEEEPESKETNNEKKNFEKIDALVTPAVAQPEKERGNKYSREEIDKLTRDILLRERAANADNYRGELTDLPGKEDSQPSSTEPLEQEVTEAVDNLQLNDTASTRSKKSTVSQADPDVQKRVRQQLAKRGKAKYSKNTNKQRDKRSTKVSVFRPGDWD